MSAIVRKQYEGVTDYLPEKLHERLKIALSHDIVNIEGERYIGGVTQEGEYVIAWPEFLNYPIAPATFKVEVNNYAARNSNCGTCAEYSQVVCEDDDIGTIGEDETVIVPILYNDAICCSPFEISLVTFNNTYLDSCDIVGNTLEIHTKTGIPIQNNVVLATYRVTCQDGMYDEADVIANVSGSVEQCLSPEHLRLLFSSSTSANFQWGSPSPAPDCDFPWFLYLASDLGTPVQSGTENVNIFPPYLNTLALNGLTPSTDYVLMVGSDCCDGDLSPLVSKAFTTQPPSESEVCGSYSVSFTDGCGFAASHANIQYLDCNNEYQDIIVFHGNSTTVCMLQDSPGNPVYYEVLSTNVPDGCEVTVFVSYLEPC